MNMKNFIIALTFTATLMLGNQTALATGSGEQQQPAPQPIAPVALAQLALLQEQSIAISLPSPLARQAEALNQSPQPVVTPQLPASPLNNLETLQAYLDRITRQAAQQGNNAAPSERTPSPE